MQLQMASEQIDVTLMDAHRKHFFFIAVVPFTFSASTMPWQPFRTSRVPLALSVLKQGRNFSTINGRLTTQV